MRPNRRRHWKARNSRTGGLSPADERLPVQLDLIGEGQTPSPTAERIHANGDAIKTDMAHTLQSGHSSLLNVVNFSFAVSRVWLCNSINPGNIPETLRFVPGKQAQNPPFRGYDRCILCIPYPLYRKWRAYCGGFIPQQNIALLRFRNETFVSKSHTNARNVSPHRPH